MNKFYFVSTMNYMYGIYYDGIYRREVLKLYFVEMSVMPMLILSETFPIHLDEFILDTLLQ